MAAGEPEAESEVPEEAQTSDDSEKLNGEVAEDSLGPPNSQVEEDLIDLIHGKALTVQEAFRITSATRTQLIIIVGAVGSGKTTLIASLFHCFQEGPFAGYLFAGSDTLLGFDQRCHQARTVSGRSTADTERTKFGTEHQLLHLQVRTEDLNSPITHVLMSDLSGEHFESAKDSVSECRDLGLIQRADHFVLLVDGEKLAKPEHRQSAKNKAIMMLRSCLDAGQLDQRSLVYILFSKWDLIETDKNKQQGIEFVGQVETSIEQQFESRVGRLSFFKVAARREKGDLPLGYGLDKPFSSWIEDTSAKILPAKILMQERGGISEFDCYFRRTLPQLFREEN